MNHHMLQIDSLSDAYFETKRGQEMRRQLNEAKQLADTNQDEDSIRNYHYVSGMFAKELEMYITWKVTRQFPFDEE
ncbi:hypothetical protein [Risungbinella massiliensis]|uniref:hypothetical protein n=1 Tax=Risungbinella massiliensis TaxID=1329796 RepID=UPI0005CB86B0|nr:hypothetical protein [Risungbinella massiliensis]